jgi:ParB family chromosome partitioning protein
MTPPGEKRNALGKGLSALIPPRASSTQTQVLTEEAHSTSAGVMSVAIEDVHPNRFQPRKTFDEATLNELAESIKEHGLMQPILVRKRASGFEIIAGERRWRACQRAGLKSIEVIVKDLADSKSFEWALIENIQREDLNPIEEAQAFKRLIESGNLTQDQLAARVAKDRTTISNSIRLLKLPEEVQRQVIAGALSMGHARALLALDEQDAMVRMARDIVKRGLSVREVEKSVRQARKDADESESPEAQDPYAELPGGGPAVRRVTDELMRRLATRVRIVAQGRRGRIEIDYASPEELERLISALKG